MPRNEYLAPGQPHLRREGLDREELRCELLEGGDLRQRELRRDWLEDVDRIVLDKAYCLTVEGVP